jgi:hypothetical protein
MTWLSQLRTRIKDRREFTIFRVRERVSNDGI